MNFEKNMYSYCTLNMYIYAICYTICTSIIFVPFIALGLTFTSSYFLTMITHIILYFIIACFIDLLSERISLSVTPELVKNNCLRSFVQSSVYVIVPGIIINTVHVMFYDDILEFYGGMISNDVITYNLHHDFWKALNILLIAFFAFNAHMNIKAYVAEVCEKNYNDSDNKVHDAYFDPLRCVFGLYGQRIVVDQ